jgi:hypothetical protein
MNDYDKFIETKTKRAQPTPTPRDITPIIDLDPTPP